MNVDYDVNPEYTMHKKLSNGISLSQEEIEILDEYEIDYRNAKSLNDLINKIQFIADDVDDDILYNLLDVLAERNYYENTQK
jgi:hypothetical protein